MAARLPERWRIPPARVVLWSVFSALPLAVVVMVGAYLSWQHHESLQRTRDRIDATYEALGTLNRLVGLLQQADAAMGAFVITGEAGYLLGYARALRGATPLFARVREQIGGDAVQVDQVQQFETLMARHVADTAEVVRVRQVDGFDAARRLFVRRETDRLGARIGEMAHDIAQRERELLARGQRSVQRRERQIFTVGAAIALLSILTRVGVAAFIVRWRKRHATNPLDDGGGKKA